LRDGRAAVLLRPDARRFASDLWIRRRGLTVSATPEAPRDALFDCDRYACLPRPGVDAALWAGRRSPKPAEFRELCAPGRLVVLRAAAPPWGCEGAFLLEAADFERGGSAELWRTKDGWRIRWANDLRGRRPWTR
jgi:competence protein ComEC